MEQATQEMLEAGIIERSQSTWSFPIVIVGKKDGSYKFCVIFRAVNKIAKLIAYPLPRIDDISVLLSTFNLRSGYWEVAMGEEYHPKVAFGCHLDQYQFRVMPFVLPGSPGVIQQLMSVVLKEFAMDYVDYILVFSRDPEEYFHHFQLVFDLLKQQGLMLKLPKYRFVRDETNQLGFVINKKWVKPDTDKVEVIRSVPEP